MLIETMKDSTVNRIVFTIYFDVFARENFKNHAALIE
jgi:hypothetical protein